ncbi:MAG: UDP-N-acetylmuramoyl-L-alanyl-D-glutamate--2,6-diaminopimelate ligase [Clostridia bacterium]
MKLLEILSEVFVKDLKIDMNTEITSIESDSRKIVENSLFIAIKGFEVDGHKYIEKAIENGAIAVLCEEKPEIDIPFILVDDARLALSKIANNFYQKPSKEMDVLGITGTNGKTTTTYLVKHILEETGKKAGLIGTNQNMIGQKVIETERTTPESIELQSLLRDMQKEDCQNVVMEVSSHALALHRVNGVYFKVGAFTNISQDHLDFHETIEEYAKAKSKLFSRTKFAVINLDDEFGEYMAEEAKCTVLSYGIERNDVDLKAQDVELLSDKVVFNAKYLDKTCQMTLNIPGRFSVYNALTAIGICLSLGIDLEEISTALAKAKGVSGRIEVVPTPLDYTVIVDYAHTPDGIINVLKAVKGFAKGRVIGVFGCGGDRDKIKRPLMAKACSRYSDLSIVTSDNPRSEEPKDIIEDIIVGFEDSPYEKIEDRREAIAHALSIAKSGDVVVIMGKGHENYQEIHGVKHHLDDKEEVLKYFK